MKSTVLLIMYLLSTITFCTPEEERSFLDKFLPAFRLMKHAANNVFRLNMGSPQSIQLLKKKNKKLIVPENMKFPCDLNITKRSTEVPKTAHVVRPGDIDVIGALGDSLTAGFGVSATNLIEVLSEGRGKSFSIGGEGTWRNSLTLPNILKEFNPNLIGYSLRTSLSTEMESQFNVAEGGAVSANMPYMAKILVKRIKSDLRVDLKNDWKMITYMAGDNDFCLEICYKRNPEIVLQKHKEDLLTVLRTLKSNLPRTIVNVIPPPHLHVLSLMEDKPSICYLTHTASCPCIVGMAYKEKRELFSDIMRKWQKLDIEIANLPEFDLDDFTVIPHNYTLNYTFPTTPKGGYDYSYLSEDCFHFSEKGQSRFANDLWNSIMEPFGNKSTDGSDLLSKFKCPSEEYPFIFTRRNSPNFKYKDS